MSESKKDGGETPSGVSHPYSDKPAIVIAVAKAQAKRAAAESASSSGATVPVITKPHEDKRLVTREEMRSYLRSMGELRSMIERLVIASPWLGTAAKATKTPSPKGLGNHFDHYNVPLIRTPATMVPELALSTDVCDERPKT
ncbi:hypothetical protein LPJ73_001931, partial [Coemansia sp. RSA 2703]